MITLSTIDQHHSSSVKIYNNLQALAARSDLYTGDDFYFGFDSSNQTFLDIIGGHQPLAIKHGPTLSLYQHTMDGYTHSTYYIDPNTRTLLPVLAIEAKPTATASLYQLLPWSFTDFYLRVIEAPESEHLKSKSPRGEIAIQSALEKLATNTWPTDKEINDLSTAAASLQELEKGLSITLEDLHALKKQMQLTHKPPSASDYIAPYNPFYDNGRIDINELVTFNPERITVREVRDKYPRIEVIFPNLSTPERFGAIFETTDPVVYQTFQQALNDPETMQDLLHQHFAEQVSSYLEKHKILDSTPDYARHSP